MRPGASRCARPLAGAVLLVALPAAALGKPTVQPIFVRTPGALVAELAQAAFSAQCQRLGGLPPVTVDLAAPPPPRAPAALDAAVAFMGELRWQDALRELEAAANDAVLTGAAGLTTAQLADIYLYRAIVREKLQPSDTARAWEDYVRAATYNPERVLDPGRVPPAAIENWTRAAAAVAGRASGTLIVRAPADATISIDARTPVRSPALLPGLRQGEHLVRVEEPGRWPWAATVPLASSTLEMEAPVRPERSLDDGSAADIAKKNQAGFALVAEQHPGRGQPMLVLRLVEASSRMRRAAALVMLPGDRDLSAAVERLLVQASGPPAAPVASAPPSPLVGRKVTWLLSVTGALAVGLAAGLIVDRARADRSRAGFTTTLDLPAR